jgi:undecaprenyl-diphosphatase
MQKGGVVYTIYMIEKIIYFITNEWVFFISIALLIAALYNRHRKLDAIELISAVSLVSLTTLILKEIFALPRPTEAIFATPGYAFPSFHASLAIVLAILIYVLFIRQMHNRKERILADIILCGFVFFIGWTRIWFQVHSIEDVIGGFAVGIMVGLASVIWFRKVHEV